MSKSLMLKKIALLSEEQAEGEEHAYCELEPPHPSDCFRGSDRFASFHMQRKNFPKFIESLYLVSTWNYF